MNILLTVSGGIAAFKAVQVLRLLTEAGHQVQVFASSAALRFVGVDTWQALSHRKVYSDTFSETDRVVHVELARWADVFAVVPATANTLSHMAHGLASDIIGATYLMVNTPVLIAPAMHTEMWMHAATQDNVRRLQERGHIFVGPDSGRLTGTDSGAGRLSEPAEIAAAIVRAGAAAIGEAPADILAGRHVIVTAGGTREFIDPVRFIGNRSTGKQGVALAQAAADLGAQVTLIGANIAAEIPAGVQYIPVETTAQMQAELFSRNASADVVVMNAAIADYRPVDPGQHKMKKDPQAPRDHLSISVVENPDLLKQLVAEKHEGQLIVGFAAETGDESFSALELGQRKAQDKKADLLVLNEVGLDRGFGTESNEFTLLDAAGVVGGQYTGTKLEISYELWRHIAKQLA